jgi:hypothetical protein
MNENDAKKKEQKKILKDSIMTLIGTEIFRLGINSLLVELGLSTYLISYLRFFQDKKTLTLQYSYFFRLAMLLVMNIFGIFTPYIQKKLGFRIVVIFIGVSGTLFYFILYLSTNYYLSLFSHFLSAVSNSFALLIERNLMGYFYEIRGKLNGGLAVINSLISSGYNMLAEKYIINPFSDEADIDENFYSFDVSQNLKIYFIIIMIIFILGTIFGLILIIPYDITKHRNAIFGRKNSLNVNEENNVSINIENEFKEGDDNKILLDDNDSKEEKESENNKSVSQKKKPKMTILFIKKALKSKRILRLFLMGIFSSPILAFLNNMWRPIAIRKGIPTIYQQNINTYTPFVSCASTLIFSSLSDSISFKYLFISLAFINTFAGACFYFTLSSPLLFTLILLFNTAASAGRLAIIRPHYMKVFGLKRYIQIGGIIGLYRVIMLPLNYFFMFYFDDIFAKRKENISDKPYIILFISCSALNAISIVLGFFEPEDEFVL